MNLKVVILTATDNALFNSKEPKYLHPFAGYPILTHIVELAYQLSPEPPVILVDLNEVDKYKNMAGVPVTCYQLPSDRRGWIEVANMFTQLKTPDTKILFLHADAPLVQPESIQMLIKRHTQIDQGITFLSNEPVLSDDGPLTVSDISLNKQFTHQNYIPCIFNSDLLTKVIVESICSSENPTSDINNLIAIARKNGIKLTTQLPAEPSDLWLIHTRIDFAHILSMIYARINRRIMLSGVTIINPSSVYIDNNVSIGRDTVIYPNTHITGPASIGENCQIGPNTIIDRCTIGDRCRVLSSVLESAVMEHDADIGPFSHLRKGAYVCAHAHIGNYGEMKNSTLGPGAKMGHFSYLGDTYIGEETNIGAGTITCNFDGKEKHTTHIGDHVFIGSGTLIVAPVDIGDHAATGAGSVVTHHIPENTLVYGVPAREKKRNESGET